MGSSLSGRPDIQWTNLDPKQLLEELGPFASLEGFRELLDKAQVGQAYVGRPCLNPDDLHCPSSAPNHHSRQVGSNQVCQGKPICLPFPLLVCSSVLGESRWCSVLSPPFPGHCYPVPTVLDTWSVPFSFSSPKEPSSGI